MQNVLFQIDNPTAATGRVEFYDLSVFQQEDDGERLHFVQENHGWWDNEHKQAVIDENEPARIECFTNYGVALDRFSRLRVLRAATGFIHSFVWHPISGEPAYHMPIEVGFDSPELGIQLPKRSSASLPAGGSAT